MAAGARGPRLPVLAVRPPASARPGMTGRCRLDPRRPGRDGLPPAEEEPQVFLRVVVPRFWADSVLGVGRPHGHFPLSHLGQLGECSAGTLCACLPLPHRRRPADGRLHPHTYVWRPLRSAKRVALPPLHVQDAGVLVPPGSPRLRETRGLTRSRSLSTEPAFTASSVHSRSVCLDGCPAPAASSPPWPLPAVQPSPSAPLRSPPGEGLPFRDLL